MSKFNYEHYQSLIQKLSFRITCVKLLVENHVGKTRREALKIRINKKNITCRQDYAKRLVRKFATEIQSYHFGGNNYSSIDGVELEYYKNTRKENFLPKIQLLH